MPSAAAIVDLADADGRLTVRATPNASSDAILMPSGLGVPELMIRTTASPEGGKANEAILRLLSRALDIPASDITLVRGATARIKVVRIRSPRG